VRFFNLSTALPLLDDHIVLDSMAGLLLLLRHPDTAIGLLHPFTGDIAELPPVLPLLPQICLYVTESIMLRQLNVFLRGVCSAVTVNGAGAITVTPNIV
jgi:hypothetical protein